MKKLSKHDRRYAVDTDYRRAVDAAGPRCRAYHSKGLVAYSWPVSWGPDYCIQARPGRHQGGVTNPMRGFRNVFVFPARGRVFVGDYEANGFRECWPVAYDATEHQPDYAARCLDIVAGRDPVLHGVRVTGPCRTGKIFGVAGNARCLDFATDRLCVPSG